MSSKRARRRKSCEGKKAHETEASAHGAVLALRKQGHQYVNSYRCAFCGKFHIGHQPKQIRQAIAAGRGEG